MAFILGDENRANPTPSTKRQAMIEETNAIGTTFLRSEMLSASAERHTKELLLEYVTVRMDSARTQNLPYILKRSEEIHTELWQIAISSTQDSIPPPYVASFVSSPILKPLDDHFFTIANAADDTPGKPGWAKRCLAPCLCPKRCQAPFLD